MIFPKHFPYGDGRIFQRAGSERFFFMSPFFVHGNGFDENVRKKESMYFYQFFKIIYCYFYIFLKYMKKCAID